MSQLTFLSQMPMHGSKRDKVLKTLELPRDQSAMRYSLCQHTFSTYPIILMDTYPMDTHTKHRDGSGPSLEETPRRSP